MIQYTRQDGLSVMRKSPTVAWFPPRARGATKRLARLDGRDHGAGARFPPALVHGGH
jgi:hypothetical protein